MSLPIPVGASKISGVGSISGRINTVTLNIVITIEAGQAVSSGLVESVAL